MKNASFFFRTAIALAVTSLLVASCGKDGSQGSATTVGNAGPLGPVGKNGSVMYAGSTVPAASTGATGDYYLDKSANKLYGPKADDGWGISVVLEGATAMAHPDAATGVMRSASMVSKLGSEIFSDSGVPPATLGTLGDYYFDKDDSYLYGPKTPGGWGAGLVLDGNANVLYSPWFMAGPYVCSTNAGTLNLDYNLPAPAITQSILDTRVVAVYGKATCCDISTWPAGQVDRLPVVLSYVSSDVKQIDTWSAYKTVGNIRINFQNNNNSYEDLFLPAFYFRYVIVPESELIARHIDVNKYSEMKAAFSLKD